jgi:hypothetical protein
MSGLLLSGCLGRSDAIPPMVGIREPKNGTTNASNDLRIVGYAMDDQGVEAVRVNGVDLLDSAVYAGERGKRFVEFAFAMPNLNDGLSTSRIEVEDVTGRKAVLNYDLQIDNEPPTLEIVAFERRENGRIAVEGVARDNLRVSGITINNVPVQFTPATEHRFELNLPAGDPDVVLVEDGAGNRIERVLEPRE